MKKKQKYLGLLVIIVLVFGGLFYENTCIANAEFSTEAESETGEMEKVGSMVASGTCGENTKWELDEAGILTVSGTGAIENCGKQSEQPWYSYSTQINEIIIEDGITSIGTYAFIYVTSATSVKISDTVTSIGAYAFYGCSGLTDLSISSSSNMRSIGAYAFYKCIGLTDIAFPEGLTTLGTYAFCACKALTSVTIPSTLTEISNYTFYNCSKLVTVSISKGISQIGQSAFYQCTELKDISIPDSVTVISNYAFYGCRSLEEVIIPDSVLQLGTSAFSNCSGITNLTLSNQLKTIGDYAFHSATSLTKITLPATISNMGKEVFCSCKNLTNVTLSEGVTSLSSYAFYGCSALSDIEIPNSIKSIGAYAFYNCTGLKTVVLSEGVERLEDYSFANCTNLESMTLPDSLDVVANNVLLGSNEGVTIKGNTSFNSQLFTVTPAVSTNKDAQEYISARRYGNVVTSYLFENSDGTLTRVEQVDREITVEIFTTDGILKSRRNIPFEKSIWGGFYAGEEYNYFFFGQQNSGLSNSVEVIRVVRYTKNWERVDSVGLYGANTYIPFDAGSLRATECGNMLYVRTCHEMYSGHQANLTFAVNTSTMEVTYCNSGVSSIGSGYVSHSFNQFITTDGTNVIAADHGDAYPRAVVLLRYSNSAGKEKLSDLQYVQVLSIQGWTGDNATGVSINGLETSDTSYLVAGNSVAQDSSYSATGVRNIFVIRTSINDFSKNGTTINWLTDYEAGVSVSNPQFVKISGTRFMVLWTANDVLNYVLVNENGEAVSEIYQNENVMLSDCKPILVNGKVMWYATNKSTPVFYSIDSENIENVNTVVQPSVENCNVTLGVNAYTYDGKEKRPIVTVRNGSVTLPSTQYTVEYTDNVNAGVATVTITGKGNYTGILKKTFTIQPKSLSSSYAYISLSGNSYTYDGEPKVPEVTSVRDNSRLELIKDIDYTVEYTNNVNAGVATVVITGKGNYTDTREKTFTIQKASQTLSITSVDTSIELDSTTQIVADGKGEITYASQSASIAQVSEEGIITGKKIGRTKIIVTASGNDNYNKATVSFYIDVKAKDISDYTTSIEEADSIVYDGSRKTPAVSVMDGVTELSHTDYTLTYANNVNAGVATVTITGKGNYTGTLEKTFVIQKADPIVTSDITQTSLAVGDVAQIRTDAKTALTYTSSNEKIAVVTDEGIVTAKAEGSVRITITAQETQNYKEATVNYDLTVTRINLSDCIVELSQNQYTYDGNKKMPEVTVSMNSVLLVKDIDYKVTYRDNIKVGTATITIIGKDKYTGTKTVKFTIEKADNKVTISNSEISLIKDATTKVQNVQISATKLGGSFTYISSDKKVTVSKSGKVRIPKNYVGTVTITVKAEDSNYQTATATATIAVKAVADTMTVSNLTKDAKTKAQTYNIKLTRKSNGKLTYTSSNAAINVKNGKVVIAKNFVGTAEITVKEAAAGIYKETSTTFVVTTTLKGTKLASVTNVKGQKMKIKWVKNTNVSGYQIQYSTDKNFKKSVKSVSVFGASTVSNTIGGLKKGSTYYVRIRTKLGTKYSDWSESNSVTIKNGN